MKAPGRTTRLCLFLLLWALVFEVAAQAAEAPGPTIDGIVSRALAAAGRSLNAPIGDEAYIRRVYLDLLGTTPTVAEQDAFLADPSPERRARLVEGLFDRPGFADYLALKWGDILRIKSEYPSNLWPNAVQAYHQWVREAMRTNLGYDKFARALITGSGSNFRDPEANFFRVTPSRDPASFARLVSQTFLGLGYDSLEPGTAAELGRFFSRLAFKRSLEWKEELVYTDPLASGSSAGPAAGQASVAYRFPDGTRVEASPGTDPRLVFADWLCSPTNPWFARAMANRIWSWLLGTGIREPVDEARPGQAEASPELLDLLARTLVDSGWDIRALYRLVLASRTYAQDSRGEAEPSYARYRIRRLDAEVLADALYRVTGKGEAYVSPIPEPFTYIPKENPSISLADGSITSSFLVKFGRPSRDRGLASERNSRVTVDQELYLLNSTALRQGIEQGPLLAETLGIAKAGKPGALVYLYRSLLGRSPSPGEAKTVEAYLKKKGGPSRQALTDIAWALVNSAEFLFRH